MKKIIYLIMVTILQVINNFLDKKNRIIIKTDTLKNGSGGIFYNFLKGKNIKNVMIFTNKIEISNNNFKLKSLKGLYYFLTSKYIIATYYPASLKGNKQFFIYIDHGIPIKSLEAKPFFRKNIDIQCSHSKFIDEIYIKGWNLKPETLKHLGEPIFDKLINPDKFISDKDKKEINKIIDKKKQNILYAPTYRNSKYGLGEGNNLSFSLHELIKVINLNQDKHFIIAPHPEEYFDEQDIKTLSKLPNCIFIRKIPIENYLKQIDFVITDCSFVYFYGLYLDKKVISFFPDSEDYKKTRGFVFADFFKTIPREIFCKDYLGLNKLLNNFNLECLESLQAYKQKIFPKKINSSCDEIFKELQKQGFIPLKKNK